MGSGVGAAIYLLLPAPLPPRFVRAGMSGKYVLTCMYLREQLELDFLVLIVVVAVVINSSSIVAVAAYLRRNREVLPKLAEKRSRLPT